MEKLYNEHKDLPIGRCVRVICPFCGRNHKMNMSITRTKDALVHHCFKCGRKGKKAIGKPTLSQRKLFNKLKEETDVKLPNDFTTELPKYIKETFIKFGIDFDTLACYNIGYSKYLDCVVYPLYSPNGNLGGVQYRCYADETKFSKYFTRGHKPPYVCINEESEKLVLTEDVLSAIKLSKYSNSMSLLGTSLNIQHIQWILKSKFKHVYIWFDNDEGGEKGIKESTKMLSLYGIDYTVLESQKDPKEEWHSKIKEKLDV